MTKMYVIDGCPGCEQVKKWLVDNNIEVPLVFSKKKDKIWQEKIDGKWTPIDNLRGFPTLLIENERIEGSSNIIKYLGEKNDRRKTL